MLMAATVCCQLSAPGQRRQQRSPRLDPPCSVAKLQLSGSSHCTPAHVDGLYILACSSSIRCTKPWWPRNSRQVPDFVKVLDLLDVLAVLT